MAVLVPMNLKILNNDKGMSSIYSSRKIEIVIFKCIQNDNQQQRVLK